MNLLEVTDNRTKTKVRRSVSRAARIIGVHRNTIYYWINNNKLPETFRFWTVSK